MGSVFRLSRRAKEQRRWFDTLGKQQSNGFSWDSTVIILAYRLELSLGAWSYEHFVCMDMVGFNIIRGLYPPAFT